MSLCMDTKNPIKLKLNQYMCNCACIDHSGQEMFVIITAGMT